MMNLALTNRKILGQVFTPRLVAQELVAWAVRQGSDRLLDPSCGDGRFVSFHQNFVGVDVDERAIRAAKVRAPWAKIYEADFFDWACDSTERFDAVVGNPPFIRYQHFSGSVRNRALKIASSFGAQFNGLASSWAPFLVVAASMLKKGGRLGFVVPAEIGHAPYAAPLVEFLSNNFRHVQLIAVKEKLFPTLSQDTWILLAKGYGAHTDTLQLSVVNRFTSLSGAIHNSKRIPLQLWRKVGFRLRKFLLSDTELALYDELTARSVVTRLGNMAEVRVGYVTGANDFFHLRPSTAKALALPKDVFRIAVRNAQQLPKGTVDDASVRLWLRNDQPVLLLHLERETVISREILRYLDSIEGVRVRAAYKCRSRDPWYAVPDVRVPHAFLSYMSGISPVLVRNEAGCVCSNSLHAVFMRPGSDVSLLQQGWDHPLTQLSCELEGHPLGGGMLKAEPREATNISVPLGDLHLTSSEKDTLMSAITEMRSWRHYGKENGSRLFTC